jgi:hypothetical protein
MQNEILPVAAQRFLFNRCHLSVLFSFDSQNFNEIVDTFLVGTEICLEQKSEMFDQIVT